MGRLKILPANVANMIAAGEVVQRPASVVKELMENAVDSGATRIDVVVKDSGRTLVQVIDNGCGMTASEAVLCFERHATSKIASAEDLSNIGTYGFRGEALASIAAVAEVTLRTRRPSDELGTQVSIGSFNEVRTSSVSAPSGSNFAVRNLFYNTPARRKFLKSDNIELKHIIEEFVRVAITRPDTAFSLDSNGRSIYVLNPAKSLKFRILDLLGNAVAADMVDLDASTSVVRVSGFVGKPGSARKAQPNQFFFVNGRYFRSPYLHKAVMKAYEDLIPEGVTPAYFIFLDIDPGAIDVNIHPTKTEIKFEDDSVVFQVLCACVKETLGRNSFRASLDFDRDGSVELPQLGKSFEAYRGAVDIPAVEFDGDYDPFSPQDSRERTHDGAKPPKQDYGALFEDKPRPASHTMVLGDKYILNPTSSGLMVVSIKRAYERILYEKILRALSKEDGHVSQTALFPVQVQVGAGSVPVFEEHAEMLSRLGFDITPFGSDCVVVNGVPEGYSCEGGKVAGMVEDLLLILSEEHGSLPEMMRQGLAGKMAKLGSVNSGPLGSPFEAQKLLDALFGCDNAELTPGGRRIVAILPFEEFDKRF